jgi:histidyl-tRNA synthetase
MKVLASSAADLITSDPLIVRAFEYYTSTVFEVFDTNPANNRSLFGGGRYSNLASLFTPQQIPGIGFGMGDVTIHDFLDTHGLLPQSQSEFDVAVIPVEDDLSEFAPASIDTTMRLCCLQLGEASQYGRRCVGRRAAQPGDRVT